MKRISVPFAAAALAACAMLTGVQQAVHAAPAAEPAIDAHYGTVIEAYTQDMSTAKAKYGMLWPATSALQASWRMLTGGSPTSRACSNAHRAQAQCIHCRPSPNPTGRRFPSSC